MQAAGGDERNEKAGGRVHPCIETTWVALEGRAGTASLKSECSTKLHEEIEYRSTLTITPHTGKWSIFRKWVSGTISGRKSQDVPQEVSDHRR